MYKSCLYYAIPLKLLRGVRPVGVPVVRPTEVPFGTKTLIKYSAASVNKNFVLVAARGCAVVLY